MRTRTIEREQRIDEMLTDERVEVLACLSAASSMRCPTSGRRAASTILPVVVEEIVVQRRLVLKEEVHLRSTRTARAYQETIILRHQDAIVTRTHAGGHEMDVGDGPGISRSAQDL